MNSILNEFCFNTFILVRHLYYEPISHPRNFVKHVCRFFHSFLRDKMIQDEFDFSFGSYFINGIKVGMASK